MLHVSETVIHEIQGGQALVDWFGRRPRFHDGNLMEVTISAIGRSGMIRVHGFNMTNQIDADGYFVLDRHAIVSLALEGVAAVHLDDVDMTPGIVGDLCVTRIDEFYQIEWDSSYGIYGSMRCKSISATFVPCWP